MEQEIDWSDCPLINIDADVVHGEPVFKGTRLPVENVVSSVYAFEELQGMTEQQAIAATLKSFPPLHQADAIPRSAGVPRSPQAQLRQYADVG